MALGEETAWQGVSASDPDNGTAQTLTHVQEAVARLMMSPDGWYQLAVTQLMSDGMSLSEAEVYVTDAVVTVLNSGYPSTYLNH